MAIVISKSTDAQGNTASYMSDGTWSYSNAQGQPISAPSSTTPKAVYAPDTQSPGSTPGSGAGVTQSGGLLGYQGTGGFTSAQPQDQGFATAQSNLTPGIPTTEAEFFSQFSEQMNPVIDAINRSTAAAEAAASQGAAQVSTQETGAMNVGLNMRGLAGSTEGQQQASAIESERANTVAQAVAQAEQARALAIAGLTQHVQDSAISAFQQAQQESDAKSQAYIAQKQAELKTSLSGLAAAGTTIDDLKLSNPVEYQSLLQYAGGDENTLNALFLASSSASLLNNGQPLTVQGNTLVYGVRGIDKNGNPTIKTISTTIPDLPQGYKVSSFNQSANGQVAYIAFPTDANGNQTVDPTKPNNGIISGMVGGGTTNAASQGSTPDPTSTAITAQTGLSINAFNFLTQGTTALSRMSSSQRAQVQSEAQDWANKNGIDLSTFQSQFKANNETLADNVSRFNNTKIAEGEVTGSLDNLNTSVIEKGLGDVNIENVGKILAGQQINDPVASKYAFYFNDLRNSLAYFYAAQQGKSSPDIIDNEDAANVITVGLSSGGISGLQDAVSATTDKMKTIMQSAVDSAQQNVWNLFGVGKNYKPQGDTGGTSDTATIDGTNFKLVNGQWVAQ